MLHGSFCVIGDVDSTVDKKCDESEIGHAVGSQGNENVKRSEIERRGHTSWTAYIVG